MVQIAEYSGRTRSIAYLLMPWLPASPGHQLCRINRSLSSMSKDFNSAISVLGNDRKWKYIYLFCPTNSAPKGLTDRGLMTLYGVIYSDHEKYQLIGPGKFEWNFRHVIFKHILVIDGWGIACEIALIWMSLDFADDQSTLVQVMAWCRQATSHYLSQCWPRSLSPYGVIRPQWVQVMAAAWRHQTITWSNENILSVGPQGANFSDMLWKMSSRLQNGCHLFQTSMCSLPIRFS